MNRIRIFLVLALGMALLHSAEAQITDSEESATMLAYQCSLSSGYALEGYMPYARGLAKTIAQVPAAGQEEVFGYLPALGGNSGAGADSGGTTTTPDTSAASGGSGDPAGSGSGNSGNGWLAAFFDWLASLL